MNAIFRTTGRDAARVRGAIMSLLLLAAAGAPPAGAQEASDRPVWRPVILGTEAMVAAEHPLEALAAEEVLRAGGNAFDAASAVFYMTTVVEQHQAGIGGDAFMVAYLAAEDRVVFINGTGYAPALATREFYEEHGGIPSAGPLSTDVPGAVGAFELAHARYGSLPREQVLAPAILAARRGHPLDFWVAGHHERSVEKISPYPASRELLMPGGRLLGVGDIYVQEDLARSLEEIAREGADAFYRGRLARMSADYYEEQDGLLRYEDLAGYEAEEADPIRVSYEGLDVYQSAPNSQGIVMLMALNILEGFDLEAMGHNSAEYVHVVTEAMKLGFADRNRYVADPRFSDVPTEELLSKEYAAERRGLIRMDRAMSVAPAGDPRRMAAVAEGQAAEYESGAQDVSRPEVLYREDGETSSFSIADRFGNLVSVTHSVNSSFGSGMVVPGGGYFLNNRMPYYGLEPDDVNVLEPGKRTRHTINPALALKDGQPYLAWNTPGGDNQPQAMLQAFLAVVHFGMNVQQAVEAPTVTSTAFRASMYPGRMRGMLTMPEVLYQGAGEALAALGHRVEVSPLQQPYRQAASGAGAVKMVMIDPETGVMYGGVSPAKSDYVIGW
ncbi:MAG: gamma-glutamyltransferase [Gammaproteobacteria bacterium]|nr:gamma-glutamyltransferase [Gammaproteobacteria bacterium]MYI22542.1 gamma-glutamyltransferase [Gammaproteobacteria bacterium]